MYFRLEILICRNICLFKSKLCFVKKNFLLKRFVKNCYERFKQKYFLFLFFEELPFRQKNERILSFQMEYQTTAL